MIRIVCDGVEHKFKNLPVTIGRDEDNDLPLDDAKLSRHHCRISTADDQIVVEDLDSSNGTYVNGARTQRHVLGAGDVIFIGVSNLAVEWDPEASPPARRRPGRDPEVLTRENLRLRRLLHLTHAVASEQNEERLLPRILDAAVEITDADVGFLFLVTLHGLDFRSARDKRGNNIESPEDRISRSIAREAVESGRPVVTEDASGDARFAGGRSVTQMRLGSVLCVPLKVPDGPLGAIYLENSGVTDHFRVQDIPYVTAFGEFAALTLATARHLAAISKREEQLKQSRERIGRLNARLKTLLRRQSRELAGVRADLDESRQELGLRYDFHAIVGESPAMRRVLALVDRVIESELAIFVSGESGTGKELIARAVHYNGSRCEQRFVTVNCAAIPPDLIEAELFGREAGAYTGADETVPGLFERAHLGTLFLDEIGDMPLETQGKLLRVLENGELRRLGGTETIQVDVRTVAASNRDLKELARAGGFREDLYYRLAGVTCLLPPLRDRSEDIPALYDHFLDLFCAEQDLDRPDTSPEVIDRMQAYPWPGNVRELRNEIQRLLAFQRGKISPDLLSLPVYSGDPEAAPPVHLPDGGIKELVENLEKRVLLDTMRRVDGNKTRGAALLGLSRLGLRKKLERYGLNDIL